MELYINGEKAFKGMGVRTFRGEIAVLLDWYEPGTVSGGNGGRVYIKETASGNEGFYFPSVIGGKFQAIGDAERHKASIIDRTFDDVRDAFSCQAALLSNASDSLRNQ